MREQFFFSDFNSNFTIKYFFLQVEEKFAFLTKKSVIFLIFSICVNILEKKKNFFAHLNVQNIRIIISDNFFLNFTCVDLRKGKRKTKIFIAKFSKVEKNFYFNVNAEEKKIRAKCE